VAWESQRRDLRAKRQSVEEQLQNLQSVDSAAAILQDLQVSMKGWKPQAEPETSSATPRSSSMANTNSNNNNSGRPPYPPFSSNNNGSPGQQQQAPPPPPPPPPPMPSPAGVPGSNGGMPTPTSFFSPFYDQSSAMTASAASNTNTSPEHAAHMGQMQAFAMQLQSVQRMQDWMLYQKEQECQQLRQALEERRSEVQQLQVDKALLQEKLYQQEERMKHELKLIKLAALQQQQQHQSQRRKSSNKGSSANGGGTAAGTSRDGPIVVLPDHMLQNSGSHSGSSNGATKNEVRMVTPPEEQEVAAAAVPPQNIAWEPQPQSAFGAPMAQQQQQESTVPVTANAPSFASPSDKKEQEQTVGSAAAAAQSSEIFRQESHEESVKSVPSSTVSKESSTKRRAKPPGSWIMNRKTTAAAAVTTGAAAGATAAAVRKSVSSPVDTDDFVDNEDDKDDHEPDDIQQQPSIPTSNGETERIKDGYGTDDSTDDDTSFHRLVANANSNTLPDGTDLFSVDESTIPKAAAPIKMSSTAATSTPPRASKKEMSPVSNKTKEVSSPSRGVSFPDTSDQDDNASLGNTVASSTFGEDRQKVADQTILDPYGDRGTYTGIILRSTGMPHGPGRMIYQEDRRTYDGEWRHGRWHGYGRATFANGDTYEGEYRFDQRHGRGRYQWSDGRVYDGMFREDRRHGRGTFTWPDGAVYEGEFRAGQRDGQGSYQFSDGGRYEGSWKDGRYNGYGVCKWEDGRCYKGEWLNGMAHGKGIETFADGSVRHDGQWIEDEPV
jgi:hypothetical protein